MRGRLRQEQKTVKAFDADIAVINARAKLLGCTAAEVVHEMCEALRKQTYLKELGESFEELASNEQKFSAMHAENLDWEVTLDYGLTDAT
jgi:hypothetical protein